MPLGDMEPHYIKDQKFPENYRVMGNTRESAMPPAEGKKAWKASLPEELAAVLDRLRPFLNGKRDWNKSDLTERAFLFMLKNDPEIRGIIEEHNLLKDLDLELFKDI